MKQHFNNPYSQFVRLETDFTKTWNLTPSSSLVGHVNAGVIFNYGNSYDAPFSEEFYVGGANSIRAFAVRGIGPGRFPGAANTMLSYLVQNGNTKLVLNLEYRRQLFGKLYGALFLDAGNVWNTKNLKTQLSDDVSDYTTTFRFADFYKQLAVGTGLGFRYDLDFLILRLDWGVALHVPYETSRSGFYNLERFSGSHTLNFAIGYPF